MPWDIAEFRSLCLTANLPETDIYQETLYWKEHRARHFSQLSEEVWNFFFTSNTVIEVGSEPWNLTEFECESNIEAALQAVHSMADVIAQIINVAILNSHFTEADVSLSRVYNRMVSINIAPNVQLAIERLRNSDEFRYVNAFVNTIKHRRLLDTEYRTEIGQGIDNRQGIRFKEISYEGIIYPITWATDISSSYVPRLIDLICEIGTAINDELR